MGIFASSGNTAVLLAGAVVAGLLVGSFVNLVVRRLPIMLQRTWQQQAREYLAAAGASETGRGKETQAPSERSERFNLWTPGSHCPDCKQPIRFWQNVPVLSWLALGGRCAGCKTRIPLRYPLVELGAGLLSGLVVATFGFTWLSLAGLALTWSLLALALVDLDEQLLPDGITLPLLWAGLLLHTVGAGFGGSLTDAVIGAAAGYLVLWSFHLLFRLVTGRQGMGHGDFKLLAALGAWLGWQSLLPVLVLSSLAGALVGTALVIGQGRDRSTPIPFGPWLAGAGFIMLIRGEEISNLWFGAIAV